ncbi:UNVERIFIED_CONTAM: hypothetical protein FKN15_044553 [Acipenser sinensis]
MADAREMRGDELRARLEELVAELRVRSDPRTGAAWGGENTERERSRNPWAEEKQGIKMVELVERHTAPQAEGHCVIVVEGEGGSSQTATTSSCTEMGGPQMRITEEAVSPPDTHALQQDVNKGAYYCHLQYNGENTERERSRNPWAEEKQGIKMVELVERHTAPQAEGHCVIVVKGEGGSSQTATTSSCTEMGGPQMRITEEAVSPPDTHALQQDVNKGAYYCHLQYNEMSHIESLSAANTQFTLELFRKINESSSSGNIFFSPLSITAALAMVYLGAKGNTAAQMAKNESKPVTMMYQMKKFPFNYVPELKLQILELPYVDDELSMIILLPNEMDDSSTGLQQLEKELTLEKIQEWTKRDNMDTRTDIYVHLPKFKLEESYDLKTHLAGLGMADVFCSKADLSGMNGGPGLFLSQVVHKSFVEVNEEGTEAAAATAGIIAFCMLREEHFTVDHPFLFFIRHKKTNSILFFGRYSSP